jgi:hypothetical protein
MIQLLTLSDAKHAVRCIKSDGGLCPFFLPTYAGANVGHPSYFRVVYCGGEIRGVFRLSSFLRLSAVVVALEGGEDPRPFLGVQP